MEKCWFVLQRADWRATENPDGSIECNTIKMGHIIPSPKFDGTILNAGPHFVPYDSQTHASITGNQEENVHWENHDVRPVSVGFGVQAPGFGGPPMANLGFVVERSCRRQAQIEKLTSQILNPSREYCIKSVQTSVVQAHIRSNKSWLGRHPAVFMITGLILAKNAQYGTESKRVVDLKGTIGG